MGPKFKSLKKELSFLEDDRGGDLRRNREGLYGSSLSAPRWIKYLLFTCFVASFFLYYGARYEDPAVAGPFAGIEQIFNQPSEELLQRMGSSMEEMGYTGLSREDLLELRSQGLTATYTSRMRDLGYTDLTLEELTNLTQNGVTSTFATMMQELGYELTPEQMIDLRQHNVTAFYTSNMHDLGYTALTVEELIRLQDVGVQPRDVEALIEQSDSETLPTLDELTRYRISNQ